MNSCLDQLRSVHFAGVNDAGASCIAFVDYTGNKTEEPAP